MFHPTKPLSPRFVLSLVGQLPMGSAFDASRRGGMQYRDWDITRYALVDVANSLRSMQYMYLASHVDKRKTQLPKPPNPFPTPDAEQTSKSSTAKPGSFTQMVLKAKAAAAAAKKRKAGL